MYFFPFFVLFAFFISSLAKRNTSLAKQMQEDFLTHEQNSNFVRKKDISHLDYIKVPLEQLPFQDTTDEDLQELQDKVKKIAQTDILNLTGISNTDLKYMYGAVNLDKLSTCDNNFIKLSRALYNWGAYLYKNNKVDSAQQIFEYAVSCKVDISAIYTTLASIYYEKGQLEKINDLKEQAKSLNTLMKSSILKALDNYDTQF